MTELPGEHRRPHRTARAERRGVLGLLLALLGGAAVLIATLTPTPGAGPPAGPWCVVCGQYGLIDVLQNIVLFLPLGMGLGLLAGGRVLIVSVAAFALSLGVELLQYFVIAGRDGAAGDVIMNTGGGALGAWLVATRFRIVRPQANRAMAQLAVVLTAWVGLTAALPLLLLPWMPVDRIAVDTTVVPGGAPRFNGQLRSLTVGGVSIPPGASSDDRTVLESLASERWRVSAALVPGEPTETYSGIGRLSDGGTTVVALGQSGRNFVCTRLTYSAAIRLRSPAFVLRDAFPEAVLPSREADAPLIHMVCGMTGGGRVVLGQDSNDGKMSGSISLTPGTTWALFLPGSLAAQPGIRWRNVGWLIVIALPVGFYAASASTLSTSARRRRRVHSVVAVAVALVLAQTLAVASRVGLAPASWWELASALVGLVGGAAMARGLVRNGPSPVRGKAPAASTSGKRP